MNLYMMRHGIAYEASEWRGTEFERPLTEEGKLRTRQIVEKLKERDELQLDEIWSSPLTRARQTAEIAAEVLGMNVKLVEPLQCGADLRALIKYMKSNPPPPRLMTVGHEPDCGMMLGELLGDPDSDLTFKRAGIAHVQGEFAFGKMKLIWKYAPKDVLGI